MQLNTLILNLNGSFSWLMFAFLSLRYCLGFKLSTVILSNLEYLFFNLLRWSIDTITANFLTIFCSLFFDMVFKFSFVRANFLFYQFQSQISYFLDYNRETLPGGISIFLLGSSLNCTSSHWCFFKVEHSVIYIWYKYPIFFTGLFTRFYDIFVWFPNVEEYAPVGEIPRTLIPG